MPPTIRVDRSNAKTPLITWDEGYAAYHLDDGGRIIDLGGARSMISRKDVETLSDVIVLSERSGGTQTLLDWWCNELKKLKRPRVLVHAEDWSKDHFNWSHKSDVPKAMETAVEQFGKESGPRSRARAISSAWATMKGGRPEPFELTLIIRDITAIEDSVEVALALRKLRDPENLCPGLQVIVTSPREDIFMETPEFSGYRSVADEFRPPYFTSKEIDLLSGPKLSLESDAKNRLMEHTGGHPLLVRHMIDRLQELARDTKKVTTSREIERAARQMRESPPAVVSFWQKELKQLFKKEPILVDSMRGYVMKTKSIGRQRFPPPGSERPLFFGGWLSLNQNDRWGITSRFHAHLARPIIDEFSR